MLSDCHCITVVEVIVVSLVIMYNAANNKIAVAVIPKISLSMFIVLYIILYLKW